MEQHHSSDQAHLWKTRAVGLLAGMLTLVSIIQAADIPSRLGYSYYTEQFLALVLGLSLAVVSLVSGRSDDGDKGKSEPSALDWVLSAAGLCLSVYVMIAYPSLVSRAMTLPMDALVVGTALFALVLEGLRRAEHLSCL